MNRTENDIRRALDIDVDHRAVDRLARLVDRLPDPAFEDMRHRTCPGTGERRGIVIAVLAAVLVGTLAVGLALVPGWIGNSRRATPAGSIPTPVFSRAELRPVWTIAVGRVPGYVTQRVIAISSGTSRETLAQVDSTSRTRPESGTIDAQYCALRLDACVKGRGTPITVNGGPGLWIPGRHVAQDGLVDSLYAKPWRAAYENNQFAPVLIWSAGRNTVVSITGTFGFEPTSYSYDNQIARRIMLNLARATSTARSDPIAMPFALRDLPSRLAPEAVLLARGQRCIGYGYGQQRGQREWVGSVVTACRVPTAATRAATVRAADGIDPSEAATVAVHDVGDGTSVVVEIDRGKQKYVSAATATRLAVTADVTPKLERPSTWITVH